MSPDLRTDFVRTYFVFRVLPPLQMPLFAIADYPLYVYNAWGARIFNIPNTKVVLHVTLEEKNKAIRRIDRVIGEMQTKQLTSERASETSAADSHRETMEVLLEALQRGNESLLNVTLTVTAYNYLEDADYRRSVRRELTINNFKVSTLYGLQQNAFAMSGLTPTAKLKNYTTGINSSSLAAVFPFVRTICMDNGGFLLGTNYDSGYPFILNIWKRDALHQNSNAMVIGLPGSGKSYFLKTLALNEWANGTKVIILDPEAEYRYFFSFMYFMGTRKGEALALTWQDVDFAKQEVRINKSLNRKQPEKGVEVVLATDPTSSSMGWHKINNRNYEVTTPKNKTSIRRVWMTESVVKILKDLREESEKDYDFAETDFVFGGKLPLSDQTVRRKMDENRRYNIIVKEIGAPGYKGNIEHL